MVTPNVSTMLFKALGATNPRQLQEHVGDILDVRDFGATGGGSASFDDRAAFQACIDAAFGPSGSPHGQANAYLNRQVYIPPGLYWIGPPGLVLTNVCGGRIFGMAKETSRLLYQSSTPGGSFIRLNGVGNCSFENFSLFIQSAGLNAGGAGIDVNWDGTTGTHGQNNNLFMNLNIGGSSLGAEAQYAFRIRGSDGANNLFIQCGGQGSIGLSVESATALGQTVISGGYGGLDVASTIGIKVTAGSIGSVNCIAMDNVLFGFDISSGIPISIYGCRMENLGTFFKINGGQALLVNCITSELTTAQNFINMAGGAKVLCDACSSGGLTVGSGTLYRRGCNLPALTGAFTGTTPQNV